MYTIKGAAEKVGITASTLRAWERRYGIVRPDRTESGYRLYSTDDVNILGLMARLVEQGRPPSLAAAEARRQYIRPTNGPDGPDPALIERLLEAAATFDGGGLASALDDMLALGPFETVVDTHLLPAMEALGRAWATGGVSVAGEHLAANAVMRRLATRYEGAAVIRTGPRILIGMAPGGQHEIGLFAFAVAARRHGLRTDYLGANLPVEDWDTAIASPQVAAMVLAVPTEADVAPVRRVIESARSLVPDLLVAVGGAEQDRAPEEAIRLGHEIGPGVGRLIDELGARR